MLPRTLEPEVMDTAQDAAEYDAMDHRQPNEAFVARLVELGARGRMLDIGTGPGHIPLMVAEAIPTGTIHGVDLSEHMLAIAERRRAGSPHTDRLSYERVDAKGLPFADASFDTVFSNTILHHIPDPRPFVAEAWRVLRPGGVLLIRDLFRPETIEQVDALVAEHARGATEYQRKLFRDSFLAALTPGELRALADELGLTAGGVEVVIDTDRHVSIQRAVHAEKKIQVS